MKKLVLIIATAVVSCNFAFSQGCLPLGIKFTTQEQIDNFSTNYPGCQEIEGCVTINGSDIVNLNGLNQLTSIGSYLNIYGNQSLESLEGLENLQLIGGGLNVQLNTALMRLSGLNNLTMVDGDLYIWHNPVLVNLTGLDNLDHITGGFGILSNNSLINFSGVENLAVTGPLLIYSNNALTSFTGLNNLMVIEGAVQIYANNALISLDGFNNLGFIGGDLDIWYNPLLQNLNALENLTSIGGGLHISGNLSLTSISGLGNIEEGTIANLTITSNSSLSACDVKSICDFIGSPNGNLSISCNAVGCNSWMEVKEACKVHFCFYGGATFNTQDQIDNYQTNYPECSHIAGSLTISGNDITNLAGLNNITSIGGDLYIKNNPVLNDLTGLTNVKSVGGSLEIKLNNSLTNLYGLENITPGSITYLEISQNNQLSQCSIENFCSYLSSTNGSFVVFGNAMGCINADQIQMGCSTSVNEIIAVNKFYIYPNPAKEKITVMTSELINNTKLSIHSINGQQYIDLLITNPETQIDIATLQAGLYFIRLQNEKMVEVVKMIKE